MDSIQSPFNAIARFMIPDDFVQDDDFWLEVPTQLGCLKVGRSTYRVALVPVSVRGFDSASLS